MDSNLTTSKRVNVTLSQEEFEGIRLYAESVGKNVTAAVKDLALMSVEDYEDYQFSKLAEENMKNTQKMVSIDEWEI